MARKRMHCLTLLLAYTLLLMLFAEITAAVRENITIDDSYTGQAEGLTLRYLVEDGWTQGNLCKGCSAQPDASLAFNGTWHDATSMHDDNLQRAIEFNFTGVAVYAYFIVANSFPFSTLTNLTFSMDGEEAGSFVHQPSKDATYEYKVLAYSNVNLTNVPHSLNISTTGSSPSLVLFDYFVYTTDIDITDSASASGLTSASKSTLTISPSTPIDSISSSGFQTRTTLSKLPTPTPTGITSEAPAKHSQSHILVGVLTVVIIAAIGILAFICFRLKRSISFFTCFRRKRRNTAQNQDAVCKTSFDVLPAYTPGDVNLSAPGESDVPVSATKGQPLQMDDIRRRVEDLRTEIRRYSSGPGEFGAWQQHESSVTTLRPSESASRVQGPVDATVPRIRKEINALRIQIQHWEEQLAADNRPHPDHS